MKNFGKLLCGALLLGGLWSCSSDEPLVQDPQDQNQDQTIPTFTGDQAAMTIRIMAPGNNTRTSDVNEGNAHYSNGSDDENNVANLSFYFYDKRGDYVMCYENAKYEPQTGSTGSALIEEIGVSKIVLTDLLGQNYPSYVVAVLNNDITSSTSTSLFKAKLSQVQEALRNQNPWQTITKENGIKVASNFVMTSATHDQNNEDYYFATPLTEKNFAVQPEDASQDGNWNTGTLNAEPVNVYVERLASKVEISIGENLVGKYKDEDFTISLSYAPYSFGSDENIITGKGFYEIDLPDQYEIDGTKTTLTLRLYGWSVNGQAKKTKFFKEVNSNFVTDDGWDYNGTNRCYWAKTPGYGANKYPSSFDDVKDKGSNDVTTDSDDAANGEVLKYISWKTVVKNGFANKSAYIMPHTEAGSRINLAGNEINHPAVTEILIAGQIVKKGTNESLTLFQLSDSYYTESGIKNYILNAAGMHIWEIIGTDAENNTITSKITPSDVEVKYGYDGTFKLVLSASGKAKQWYKDSDCTDAWSDADEIGKFLSGYLPDKQSFCYNDGMLYYNVPIQHIRPYNATAKEQIKTGMFGVVRNHWYKVTIKDVKNLGHSVYRPDEHIIPPSDDTRYMIGSSINILSWRLVSSSAEL